MRYREIDFIFEIASDNTDENFIILLIINCDTEFNINIMSSSINQ
ncbi:MAG TPA: hypothetical protein VJY86_03730 [Bacilli bacterium]|nr:hypothetical protein [Bacilli bacterium]